MSGTQQNAGTGSQTLASGTASITPIGYGYAPQEGSRALYTQYNWAASPSFYEDGSQVVAKGLETCIQGVFIDNSTVALPVTIYINPHQTLICPAYSQAVFPVFFSGNPQYEISLPNVLPVGTTRLTWLNIPVSPCVWPIGFPVDGGQNSIALAWNSGTQFIKVGPGRLASVTATTSWVGSGPFFLDVVGVIAYGPAVFTQTLTFNVPFRSYLQFNANGATAGACNVFFT